MSRELLDDNPTMDAISRKFNKENNNYSKEVINYINNVDKAIIDVIKNAVVNEDKVIENKIKFFVLSTR